tara:strand:+ start:343 stop:927 length:585 start_codon:yes stop_codon:yes gene_type:complete
MPLESSNYIDGLIPSNPVSTDALAQADDHLRLIKTTVKATFPNITGAISPTHTELNTINGSTSATATTLVDADRLIVNDDGTMVQTAVTDVSNYMNANAFLVPTTMTATGTLTPGSAKSIYQLVDTTGGDVTLTIASGSLVTGQYIVIDKTVTANTLTIVWPANSTGLTLGNSVALSVGFYNGTAFSFIETVKS